MTTSLPPVASSVSQRAAPIASWWHTIVLVLIILALSALQGQPQVVARASRLSSRVPIYATTVAYELFLFAYVWLLGLKPHGVRISEIMGRKWRHFRDLLTDLRTAFLFWIVVVAVLAVLRYFLRYDSIKAATPLLPQSRAEIMMFVVLSVTAGFCEEFIFRGYLQRQFLALANSASIAIVLQSIVFGLAHLYQGWRPVLAITVYGALFGILAWRCQNLRPGMIQHAAQDSLSGIVASILIKQKMI